MGQMVKDAHFSGGFAGIKKKKNEWGDYIGTVWLGGPFSDGYTGL